MCDENVAIKYCEILLTYVQDLDMTVAVTRLSRIKIILFIPGCPEKCCDNPIPSYCVAKGWAAIVTQPCAEADQCSDQDTDDHREPLHYCHVQVSDKLSKLNYKHHGGRGGGPCVGVYVYRIVPNFCRA